jgi:flagellar biosynthesis anti-sigma factor FlgM
MKIDDRSDLGSVASPGAKGAGGVEGAGRKEGSRGAERAGSDHAELSGRAGKISQALGQTEAQRAATVERLRLAVAEGRYHPDPAAVGSAIVNDALTHAAEAGASGKK